MGKYKWEQVITDANDKKVFEELSNPNYDFRTIEGLSRSTGLPTSAVLGTIQHYPELIRKSSVPDVNGRQLYTLREKDEGIAETFNKLRTFISKSVKK